MLTEFCPAKLNLFLAVTGRRADGFHELVSVVAPLECGDTLTVTPRVAEGFGLTCDDPAVPTGEANLIIKAALAFADATGWRRGVEFHLAKTLPMGAGLGGGSSDAAGALRALNRLAGDPLDRAALATLAAEIGSDCPLFLHDGPVVVRGRGERIEALPDEGRRRLAGRWLAAEAPGSYLPAEQAECRLAAWLADEWAPAEALGFNSLERPAFGKFVALPAMLALVRETHGVEARMSGSGSACYAWVEDAQAGERVAQTVREAWGETAWIRVNRLRTAAD
jgi:4-diphosphocytidyl-2-C-methyl-D-erythritol kinase